MVNSIDDIIELHRSSGNIEDAYIKIHLDERILNLNVFTMKITSVEASKEDVDIWNERISKELKKNRSLDKEIKEFVNIFELLNKIKVRSGEIIKGECPDFLIKRNGSTIGVEITKIYVGYDWMVEKLENEIQEYRFDNEDIEGYIEYKKASDKIEIHNDSGSIVLSPKLQESMNEEYEILIKNKLFEKIRKMLDEYAKYDTNIIYASVTSPEYFDDITDLDAFTKELMYYIAHLEGNLENYKYKLIININKKWIEINLNEGNYKII